LDIQHQSILYQSCSLQCLVTSEYSQCYAPSFLPCLFFIIHYKDIKQDAGIFIDLLVFMPSICCILLQN